ncbi:hypothetical protein AMTRI_Chr10g228370 [Amborella trichopoda]
MVDQHLDRLKTDIRNLAAAQDRKFKEMMEVMNQMFAIVNTKLDNVIGSHEQYESSYNHPHRDGDRGSAGMAGVFLPKVVRLDFPKFNGEEDPTSWVCRADQFFDYHQTPANERVLLEEPFESYGPTLHQDFFGDLTKLQQAATVREYQTQFFRLLLRVGKLSQEQQVGCFISGLKESLNVDIQAWKPVPLLAERDELCLERLRLQVYELCLERL